MLILSGCGGTEIVTRTEYVDRPVPVRVKTPPALLTPCQIAPKPVPGMTWHDVWVLMDAKDAEQRSCNKRFEQIRAWQDGQ